MTKKLEMMTDKELRQYLSDNRDHEKTFSEALEILMNRNKNPFPYPPVSPSNYQELESIFKAKIQS